MGLASVAASAQRALAQQQQHAKRGMFALVERRHSYLSLKDGHQAWSTFTPAIVASVSRDGLAKEVRIAGQNWPLKAAEWRQITIDSQQRIADPERVAATLVDENGRAIEYTDQEHAVAAIRAAAGMGGAAGSDRKLSRECFVSGQSADAEQGKPR
jgi:hypothetical protein